MTGRLPLSEREWQQLVVDAARLHGWWTYHPYDSRRSAPGWPDLTLIRPPELVMVELKTDRGRLTADQDAMLERLADCGVETHVWRPADEDAVLARLARSPRRRPSEHPISDRHAPRASWGCKQTWGPHVCDEAAWHPRLSHRCACGDEMPSAPTSRLAALGAHAPPWREVARDATRGHATECRCDECRFADLLASADRRERHPDQDRSTDQDTTISLAPGQDTPS